jgi:lipopolysaccharide/colanic/teichoic acid biosynthesis glycosyltransferase
MLQAPVRKETTLTTQPVIWVGDRVRLQRVSKAAFDYFFVAPTLFLLLPLFLIIIILIKLESPGPVLHKKRVIGKQGRFFEAYNFRTTFVDAESRLIRNRDKWVAILNDDTQVADPRVTRVGYYLRRFGLEDLPRLLNILNRQMSLVGPHLLNQGDIAHLGVQKVAAITSMKPGLTGVWQIRSFRTERNERHNLELDYINNWSLLTDLQILFETFTTIWEGNIL